MRARGEHLNSYRQAMNIPGGDDMSKGYMDARTHAWKVAA